MRPVYMIKVSEDVDGKREEYYFETDSVQFLSSQGNRISISDEIIFCLTNQFSLRAREVSRDFDRENSCVRHYCHPLTESIPQEVIEAVKNGQGMARYIDSDRYHLVAKSK